MKKLALMLVVLMAMTFTTFAQSYTIDAAASEVAWTGSKLTGTHNGVVNITDGTLNLKDGALSGDFTIDMTTIKCLDLEGEYGDKLVGHLASEDFFNVEGHKTAKLVITGATPLEQEGVTHMVFGELTIKGNTNKIFFPANISVTDGEGLKADAKFSIDRTKWDIRYGSGSFFDVGDKMIYDDMDFEVSLKSKK